MFRIKKITRIVSYMCKISVRQLMNEDITEVDLQYISKYYRIVTVYPKLDEIGQILVTTVVQYTSLH